MTPAISGATMKMDSNGQDAIYKLKTANATFSLRPIRGSDEEYLVQITCRELPGLFKNSGTSSFGPFLVKRHPGRNAIERPKNLGPTAGNAVLMFPHLNAIERGRCYEFLERLIRNEIPKRSLV